MNFLQFFFFAVYVTATALAGAGVYRFLNPRLSGGLGRAVYLGEILLLGSMGVIGGMMVLSLLGLYSGPWLWAWVFGQGFWLVNPGVRADLRDTLLSRLSWDMPSGLAAGLMLLFLFRNCYFLVDVDSHSTYLYAQQLWLNHHSSLWGHAGLDMKVFVPHFNAVPYALGLALFGQDVLFPQLVVAWWTVIAAMGLFGYARLRSNSWYGLAAVMLLLFDEHVFYSGANVCCVINSALIALIFAAVYNFWEARREGASFRWVLGLVFLIQLMANKYQMLYVMLALGALGLAVMDARRVTLRTLLRERRGMIVLAVAGAGMLTWYLRNFLLTGLPAFPILAGKYGVLNWSPGLEESYNRVFVGPLSPLKCLKYLNYLFTWPGVVPTKIVGMGWGLLPVLVFWHSRSRPSSERDQALKELMYWMTACGIMIIGLCLVSFVDPRHYRYAAAVSAWTVVLLIRFMTRDVSGMRWVASAGVVLALALGGASWKIITWHGGPLQRPSWQDNRDVLTNRLHFTDIVERYFPDNAMAASGFQKEPEVQRERLAWAVGPGGATRLSAFLLPERPQVGLWVSTLIRWEAYDDPAEIVKDLKTAGIDGVMTVEGHRFKVIPAADYAAQAALWDRYPKTLFYNYGFPEELSGTGY